MANLDGLKELLYSEADLETGATGREWRYDIYSGGSGGTLRYSTNTGVETGNYSDAGGSHWGTLAANSIRASADCLTDEAGSNWGDVNYIKVYVKAKTGDSFLLFAEGSLTDTGTGLNDVKTNQRVNVTQVDVAFTT